MLRFHKYTRTLMLVSAFAIFGLAQAQKFNFKKECDNLYRAINKNQYDKATGAYKEIPGAEKHPRPYAYLWPITCLYQAANELEVLNGSRVQMKKIWNCIMKYQDSRVPARGYSSYLTGENDARFATTSVGSRFYDDNQWIGIAAMDAYFRTGKKEYVDIGKVIYRFMMTGYDTVTGGGLYWKEDEKNCKNTCSNGPGIIVALQLYKATKSKAYLDTALMLYQWTNKTLKSPDGLYYDFINIKTGQLKKDWLFSYNTGTMLQSNVYLYELTGDKQYLTEAIALAESSVKYFCDKKFRDNLWFEAVLLRGYQHLLKYHSDLKYVQAFKECTENVLQYNMNKNGMAGKQKLMDLVQQAGLVEILARLAVIEDYYRNKE